ncbi:unnamed protein product [Sphenostylis stenocarpa]|uniref:Uncharacterized protein n=1 Tax=Sphenostylis stenocarpa TaxID=92480 RepID=A0AA86SML8_9FABA|nr:unnamed protein product [Sphenostylis stenocarpa]
MAKYRRNRVPIDIEGEKEWREASFQPKEIHTVSGWMVPIVKVKRVHTYKLGNLDSELKFTSGLVKLGTFHDYDFLST